MIFDNSAVRRQDRLLDMEDALRLLNDGEYGFLSFGNEHGGYGIPVNYVFHNELIYFHCARDGEKMHRIQKCNRVCFCVVGSTKVQDKNFTTAYESVLVFGFIKIVDDDMERMRGLELLIDKYSPEYKDTGLKYVRQSLDRTSVLRLDISRMSGKAKKV